MDFSFTPEQDELRAQARSFLAGRAEPSWLELAELGWTGVSLAAELGGAGLGFLEEAVLFEEMGRALTHAPFWSTIALVLPALPPDLQAEVAAGRQAGRSRWGRSSRTSIPPIASQPSAVTRSGSSTAPTARCSTPAISPGRWAWSWAAKPAGGSPARSSSRCFAAARSPRCRSRLWRGPAGARARGRACRGARAVRPADRGLPGGLAPARDDGDGARARPLPGMVGGMVHRTGRPPGDIGCRSCQVLLRRGRSCGL